MTTELATDLPVFDVCGPLPDGTTVLEASAGTGKTFTIAALATRYVAEEGIDLADLLLVTFGRAATSELRDRVRERLLTTERALRDPGAARESRDAVVAHLATVDDAEVERRRRRLTGALSQFDAATITTTHGFCQQMLASLGMVADVDPDLTFVPDIADLREEVVDDVYLARYAGSPTPEIGPAEAHGLAKEAVSDHQAALRPRDAPPDSLPGHRHALAAAVRAEVLRRKRTRRLLDYDDLLTLLRDALTHPDHGAAAARRVRERYAVVLVDEFQDTDPVQWEILRTAFHGQRTLVLIGDPKQAIYGFRGGDVVTYLQARDLATHTATLGRNWRSDAEVLAGLDALFRGAALGDEAILVRPVAASHPRRLAGGAPVRLRQVTREPFRVTGTKNPRVGDVRSLIADDVAADIVGQLTSTRVREGDAWRPLHPGEVAVLARRNADAESVRDALAAAGVPAVVSGLFSVFGTEAAGHWLTLLTALEQPGHAGRAAGLALTPFLGWDAARLGTATDTERAELSDTVRGWARLLAERGVAALVEAVTTEGVAERVMATAGGERTLTDVRHVGEALHLAADRDDLGVAALTDWLRSRVAEADKDYAEERSRRLETDADAVQVVTIHSSKGLEFPVVYAPFEWDRYELRNPAILRYHDDSGTRLLHVGGTEDSGYRDARERHFAEERGESLRLLYVALTRAANQVVVHWAPSSNSSTGPVTRLLLGDHDPGQEPPHRVSAGADDQVTAALTALADRSAGTVALERVTHHPPRTTWAQPAPNRPELSVARLERGLDHSWRRTSYTGLTAAAHAEVVGSEPETTGVEDETDVVVRPAEPADAARALPSPMSELPGGTVFGTVVHDVLEQVDTAAADLGAELRARCHEAGTARVPGLDPEVLAGALEQVMATPLGPLAGGLTLADLPPADRLAELTFELPLAGGDTPAGPAATLVDLAELLRRHLPADDVFAPYADQLAALGPERLHGYLTGSIDAVLRRGRGADARYLVVDYKTNRLASPEEPLTLWHYRPAAMAEAMMRSHYPLQLLLYFAALHRFLRWRHRGYDPEQHLGGGLYLFVRGMAGPDTPADDALPVPAEGALPVPAEDAHPVTGKRTPGAAGRPDVRTGGESAEGGTPYGVMAWRPPTALVVGLSALLEGRRR